jgi:hypothetical protein
MTALLKEDNRFHLPINLRREKVFLKGKFRAGIARGAQNRSCGLTGVQKL